ncbi:MAG: hypothetical protein H6711_25060 [Myxococcales bacterium]|nr:hypothetical protein [Myxococcales bacterium]
MTSILACTSTESPTPAASANTPSVDATRIAPAPAPESAPPELSERPELPEGPPLHVLYEGCPPGIEVSTVAGHPVVHYVTGEVGRIDVLAPLAPRATPTTPRAPEAAATVIASHDLDPGPSRLPLALLSEVVGPSTRDLHVLALFAAGEASEYRGFRLVGDRWKREERGVWGLYDQGEGVLGFASDPPRFVRLQGDGPAPRFANDALDPTKIAVLATSVAPAGPALTLVRDPERGIWLMAWARAEGEPEVTRLVDEPVEHATLVSADEVGMIVVYTEPPSLFRWRGHGVERLPSPELGESDARLILVNVDPQGRPWLRRGPALAWWDETRWVVERVQGDVAIGALVGVEHGTPWALLADGTLWSRREGEWVQSPIAEAQRDQTPHSSLSIGGPDDPWLIRIRPALRRETSGQAGPTSAELLTRRRVHGTIHCR